MKRVADDVSIGTDTTSPESFVARRPGVQKTVRLTPAEAYLLEGMRTPYSEVVLITKCNARYSAKLTTKDLQQLIARLDAGGMLTADDSAEQTQAPKEADTTHHPGEEKGDQPERASFRNHWSFFNPEPILDSMLQVVRFLRHLHFLVPVAFVFSVLGLVDNLDLFLLDISDIRGRVSLFERILFTLFTVNLVTQLYRGLVARHFGFKTPSFGMILVFGLLPRFNIRITISENTSRRSRLWSLGAPLYIRFILFPLGIVIWMVTREQGTSLPVIGISLAAVSVISFLFVANPLLGGAGYRFLSEYFEAPNLRKRAFARLKGFFSKQPLVVSQYIDRSPAVLAYGFFSLLFSVVFIGFMAFLAATYLEGNYRGLGIAFFLVIVIYLFFRFGYQRLVQRQQRQRAKSVAGGPSSQNNTTSLKRNRIFSWLRFRFLILLAFVGACFIPYQYESGGEAEVFPAGSASLYSEYTEMVDQVYFSGGEVLEQGTVVAEQVNAQQKYLIEKTRKEIEKKKQELNILLTTPSVEQIAVAQEALKEAQLRLRFSAQELEVSNGLFQNKAISLDEHLKARQQAALDEQSVQSANASLASIKNQINPHEIEALKIQISILQDQLAYYQQELERTRLKMPIDGRIVTMNLQSFKNSYLSEGELFAEVEDISKVRVEIKIPEGDIGEVSPGDPARIRLQTYPNSSFYSQIRTVHPATVEDSAGRYVVCDSIISNEHGLLKSGMTGFAKVEGRKMLAIEAFTRALIRFVRVEVWSWVP